MGWTEYTLNRLLSAVFVLFVASIAIFSILRLIPGDPAALILGVNANPVAIQQTRARLGLDLPIWEQYLRWLGGILTLNMGESMNTGGSIAELIRVRYPRSLILALSALLVAVLISLPLGILSSTNRNSVVDYLAVVFSQTGISTPQFVLGILFILVFAGQLNVLPSSGFVSPLESPVQFLEHITLPALTLGIINGAILTRFIRSEMLEELNKEYVRTAKAYGHPEQRITRKYVLKNALIPTLTVVGLQFAKLIGGLVIIEEVFSYPGMGILILDALFVRDYPVLQAGLLIVAATFIIINLIIDVIYGFLNPKIRY